MGILVVTLALNSVFLSAESCSHAVLQVVHSLLTAIGARVLTHHFDTQTLCVRPPSEPHHHPSIHTAHTAHTGRSTSTVLC